ncbi:chemotaxis protein CheA [Marispirochaeta aestuarii]|uniref:chemotaxis protein CheA n=1 Tax=Marispirochaeta aestuarii TaxID=1963862 RepID=UPI002ABDCA90|nr:chemotaxis protein CheA [Marispirochaeta aestuarii]
MSQLDDLIGRISDFIPGDLVEGIEIEEHLKKLIQKYPEDQEKAALLRALTDEFSAIIQQTSAGDEETIKSGILKGLKKLQNTGKNADDTGPVRTDIPEGKEIEDLDLLTSFISEAQEHLESIEKKILSLENQSDHDTVNDIFRSMHTIKGVSSFLGLTGVKTLSHHMETVLDAVRKGSVAANAEMIDTLLEGVDLLVRLVDDLAKKTELKIQSPETRIFELEMDINPYVEKLVVFSDETKSERESTETGAFATEDLFTREMVEKYVAESMDLLDTAEKAILDLEDNSHKAPLIDEAFRAVHTIKGNAGFFWYGYIEKLCMDVESVLDVMRKDPRAIRNTVISSLLTAIDEIRFGLQRIQSGELKPGAFSDEDRAEYSDERLKKGEAKPLGELLVEMGAVSREAVEEALDKQGMRLGELLIREGVTDSDSIEKALKKQGRPSEPVGDAGAGYSFKRKDIRVDTERLDRLFDLMGELITAEAMVLHNPDLVSLDLPDFQKAGTYLSKITREMQEITMSIRMIPLDGLFSKMRRLVRDLSRKFSKDVNFHVSGEETEMDRNVMEEISDPLVHIIRNAIDHGIEPAQLRQKAGKPAAGNVYLDAKYEGNEIWISIQDDGGGLNTDRILQKSRERGIIAADAEPSEDEIYQLIFEPGFSTAQQVSEISGRGVGMDVVKRNLEKLRGKIDIRSDAGKGTEFILRIPLTLAIIDGITARVGSMLYSVPVNDVTSFQKVEAGQITETNRFQEVFRLRDDLIPVVRLADFFRVTGGVRHVEDGILVVSQAGRRSIALLVDEIIGYSQLVVKALPEYMGEMRAISGCSIMGDGEVSLILDIGAIVNEELD